MSTLDELINKLNTAKSDPDIPVWAAVLMDCMNVLITEIKCVNDLAARVDDLELKIDTVEQLESENKQLREDLDEVMLKVDDQEQRSRNYCLLIHGCEEKEKECVTDEALAVINGKMDLPIKQDSFTRVHRLGPRREVNARASRSRKERPRAIIIRFKDWYARDLVFKNKKVLKDSGISISENLTKVRMNLLKASEDKYGRGHVWTKEGFVLTKINNKIVTIKSLEDLQ